MSDAWSHGGGSQLLDDLLYGRDGRQDPSATFLQPATWEPGSNQATATDPRQSTEP
jgi:hypothetical protein